MDYIYHPMHMHLHADNQVGASFESHIYNAKQLGMQYIRFTGHDSRMGEKKSTCSGFDFTRGLISYNDFDDKTCGFEEIIGNPQISFDEKSMLISASSTEYALSGVGFVSKGKRHSYPLVGEVTLVVGINAEVVGDARVIIDVCLSQRPPEHKNAHIHYVFTPSESIDTPHTAEVLLKPNSDGIYRLEISKDVLKEGISELVGGLDNAFTTVRFLLETCDGASAKCSLFKFEIEHIYGYEEVIERQRVVAEEIGKKYGVKPFVTSEISAAGPHKNVFDTAVPIINYKELGRKVTHEEAINHVKKHNGIFSYNHPFEKYKRTKLTTEEISLAVEREAELLIKNSVWGATCMEVGFTEGRDGFRLKHYLKLWDMLSLAGVFITGYGDSDSHNSRQGWFSGNNFAAWTAAPSNIPFPVPESKFIKSLKAGRVYTGDPTFIKLPINFTADNLPMGAVIYTDSKAPQKMSFSAIAPDKSWEICVINNGEVLYKHTLGDITDKDGNLNFNFEIAPLLPVSFARVELYNADGRCILLTNPIYLVKKDEFSGEIPKERIY